MSGIRVAVEWSFENIVTKNKCRSLFSAMKLMEIPVSKWDHTAIFFLMQIHVSMVVSTLTISSESPYTSCLFFLIILFCMVKLKHKRKTS